MLRDLLIQVELTDRDLDLLIDFMDDAFLEGRFSEVDGLLSWATANVDDISVMGLVALDSMSYPAKDHLPSRVCFRERVRDSLIGRGETPERVRRLSWGLE